MTSDVGLLLLTAVSIGFMHTILGPDHYIPFVAMAKANDWSTRKTALLTGLCGMAHVMSSVLIGWIGLILGAFLFHLETLESIRGDAAAWLLISFGLAYLIAGVVHVIRAKPHAHVHLRFDGTLEQHEHRHDTPHVHPEMNGPQADAGGAKATQGAWTRRAWTQRAWTPWLLFLIFAFGPCEALIPILMYPAAKANWIAIVAVVAAFAMATVMTMIGAVLITLAGLRWIQLPDLHRYSHALAGAAILLCGLGVKFGL